MGKKLRLQDINKNAVTEKKHSINKIKRQETKYTIILVIFFMILFCVIGYNTLVFNYNYESNSNWDISSNVEFFGSNVLLTKDNQMPDSLGANSKEYQVSLLNKSNNSGHYQVLFTTNSILEEACGCKSSQMILNNTRFMINGEVLDRGDSEVSIYEDNSLVIADVFLEKNKSIDLSVRLWVDNGVIISSSEHFHGHFVFQEIKEEV